MILQSRFESLVGNYSNQKELVAALWLDIYTHYSEKHRAYHNLNHLEELFNFFDLYKNNLQHPDIVCFSIFYHDIIYNIWKKDNEEKSADFALHALQLINLPFDFYVEIQQQILATKTHNATSNDACFLVDFDLAILGQPEAIYHNYTQKIRKEYQLIPSLVYKNGRKKVLQHFLDKPIIYSTPTFQNLYEKQARENLTNELKKL